MNFHKYDKIKVVGDEENKGIFDDENDEIVIQEKMDGGNFRFMINNGNIIFGSRNQQITSNEGEETNISNNFKKCVRHIRERVNKNMKNISNIENYVFFGECMTKHTLNYDWENIPIFLGFDIWDKENRIYLDYNNMVDIYKKLGLDVVPLIKVCKAKDIGNIDENYVPKSKYASPSDKDQQAEGVVFKNYDKQIFAKYRREKFKEKHRGNFGGSKKYAKTDEEFFVLKYCTNARIEKCVFKLIDEGKKLEMALMRDLVHYVYEDIWEENLKEIIYSKRKVDFHSMKRMISKRCVNVLKQIIVNNNIR